MRDQGSIRRAKRLRMGLLLAALLLAAALAALHPLLGLAWLLLAFAAQQLLGADHIFYPPASDYHIGFSGGEVLRAQLRGGWLRLLEPLPEGADTLVLALRVAARTSGRWFDPWVQVGEGEAASLQYFERGVRGLRYLNASALLPALRQGREAALSGRHCRLAEGELELRAFACARECEGPVLVLAPHADDAELAAFGLYAGREDAHIATLTAGETEPERFESMAGSRAAASHLKGRLRAWDSLAVPLWAGIPRERCAQLGYACLSLRAMRAHPGEAAPGRDGSAPDIAAWRRFNAVALPTDAAPANRWDFLVEDLAHLLRQWQPRVLVLPHPRLDPHDDHIQTAWAALEACTRAGAAPRLLLYANHYHHTDRYPFGPEHAGVPLPPHFDGAALAQGLLSRPLARALQVDKGCALAMMHDLQGGAGAKQRLRQWLQRAVGRRPSAYGADDFFRKAVRGEELFWVEDLPGLRRLLEV